MRTLLPVLLVLHAPVADVASADVINASPSGFTTRDSTELASVPIAIHLALTTSIGAWWDPAHTLTGDASNLSLDARPGGCFCERQPRADPYRHLTVVEIDRGRSITLSGGLGPLAKLGATGTMTWTYTQRASRTRVEVTYEVTGDPAGRLDEIAPAVDAVLTEQLQRLKRFVESGRP